MAVIKLRNGNLKLVDAPAEAVANMSLPTGEIPPGTRDYDLWADIAIPAEEYERQQQPERPRHRRSA